jgi:hypothetical protein
MIQLAVVAAVAAVLGGVVAVTARDYRLVALGLLLAMVAAPLASSPEPAVLAIAFRVLGALLAAYLLWAAMRAQSIASEGSGIGAVAEVAAATTAFLIGWFVAPVKPLPGPLAAQAAGISLAALAVVPLAGRNVLRAGTGVALLALGMSLLLVAWVGPASSLEQIVITALLVGAVGASSLLASPIEPPATGSDAAIVAPVVVEPSAVADGPTDDVEAGPVDGPAGTLVEAPADLAAAIGQTPQTGATVPVAIPVRVSTARTTTPRSPRAARTAAPIEPHDEAIAVDKPAAVKGSAAAPTGPSAAAAPVPSRTRRLHPREPRP